MGGLGAAATDGHGSSVSALKIKLPMASAHSLNYTALGNEFARASPSARCTVQAVSRGSHSTEFLTPAAMLSADGKTQAPEGLHIAFRN